MLVYHAPTYPPKNRPYPKKSLPFWEFLFSLFFFSNSVNKIFFKIIKSCFNEESLQRLLLYAFLPYTASISSCVLGAQKNPLIETGLLSTQNTCFGPETKKREKIYLRSFQNESVQLQWLASFITFSKHPLFGVVGQNFISVQLRECAGSSEPYLLQLCYIMRCPMWGEGKRIGERRGSRVEVYKRFWLVRCVFSFFIFCSSGGFVYNVRSAKAHELLMNAWPHPL